MKGRWAVAAAVAGNSVAAYIGGGRSWQLRWGATGEEVSASLAGDALIATADLVATRAITIRAPADLIWPWIAQLGQGRGGFYAYDWLENLLASTCTARIASYPSGRTSKLVTRSGWPQIPGWP
jgi:hypothetical protein